MIIYILQAYPLAEPLFFSSPSSISIKNLLNALEPT